LVSKSPVMDTTSVRDAYRRWAPIYDLTFGKIAEAGRKNAVQIINRRRGRVLEVGVGTGLSLSCYGSHLTITGIDLSSEMLAKAEDKVDRHNLANVAGLHEMDAGALAFPDESFDTVVAMYVMTVVPEPERVMLELERVCATGGEVILVNHFSEDEGVRGFLERKLAPFADLIGWRPVFDIDQVLVCEDLRLAERRSLRPFGLFTMLRFVKEPGFGLVPQRALRAKSEVRVPARVPARSPLPEPIRVRIKWQVARALVHCRRLLDTHYWRSLYRRLASQLAE
jgi:phosphatidylethanolamine/phosphatidyl-N-methylethanolamine N-methyltransferase